MKRGLSAFVLALSVSASLAAGASKETVAVMDFTAINAPGSEASVLSEFVRSAVIQSGVFTVVDKKNMDKMLAEQAFQQTGCTSDECAVKLGKILNVRKMIVGSYSIMGQTRFLTSRLVDVETGKIEASAKEKGFSPEDADTAAEKMVHTLIGGEEPADSAPAPAPVVERPVSRRLYAEAPVRQAPPSGDGYIMFFYGGSKAVMRAVSIESLRVYGTIPTWKDKFVGDDIPMEQAMAPIGFRAGFWGEIWGVDGELSMERLRSKAVNGRIEEVAYDGSSYSYPNFDVSLPGGWRIEQPINLGMNLYLHVTSKWAFQPYIGFGFGMAFDIISSDSIQLASREKFSELGIGGFVKFPMGARLNITKWLFVYGEYQPTYKVAVFSTTVFQNNWRQTYQISSKTATGGLGFLF